MAFDLSDIWKKGEEYLSSAKNNVWNFLKNLSNTNPNVVEYQQEIPASVAFSDKGKIQVITIKNKDDEYGGGEQVSKIMQVISYYFNDVSANKNVYSIPFKTLVDASNIKVTNSVNISSKFYKLYTDNKSLGEICEFFLDISFKNTNLKDKISSNVTSIKLYTDYKDVLNYGVVKILLEYKYNNNTITPNLQQTFKDNLFFNAIFSNTLDISKFLSEINNYQDFYKNVQNAINSEEYKKVFKSDVEKNEIDEYFILKAQQNIKDAISKDNTIKNGSLKYILLLVDNITKNIPFMGYLNNLKNVSLKDIVVFYKKLNVENNSNFDSLNKIYILFSSELDKYFSNMMNTNGNISVEVRNVYNSMIWNVFFHIYCLDIINEFVLSIINDSQYNEINKDVILSLDKNKTSLTNITEIQKTINTYKTIKKENLINVSGVLDDVTKNEILKLKKILYLPYNDFPDEVFVKTLQDYIVKIIDL